MSIFVTSFSRGKVDGFMNCETFKSWSWLLSNELTSHFDGSIWLVIGLWNAFNHYGTEIQDGAGKIPNMFVHIDIMPSCSFRTLWTFSTAHPWCQSPVPPHSKAALLHFYPWLWRDVFSLNQSAIIWGMWHAENVHSRNTEKEGCGCSTTVLR